MAKIITGSQWIPFIPPTNLNVKFKVTITEQQKAVSSAVGFWDVTQWTPQSGRHTTEMAWRALILDRHTSMNHFDNSVINYRRPTQHAAGVCHDLQFSKRWKCSSSVAYIAHVTLPDGVVRVQGHAAWSAFNHSPRFRERAFSQLQGRETQRRFPEVSKALQNLLEPVLIFHRGRNSTCLCLTFI